MTPERPLERFRKRRDHRNLRRRWDELGNSQLQVSKVGDNIKGFFGSR